MDLPVELIHDIFDMLGIGEIISYSMTSKYNYAILTKIRQSRFSLKFVCEWKVGSMENLVDHMIMECMQHGQISTITEKLLMFHQLASCSDVVADPVGPLYKKRLELIFGKTKTLSECGFTEKFPMTFIELPEQGYQNVIFRHSNSWLIRFQGALDIVISGNYMIATLCKSDRNIKRVVCTMFNRK